MGMDPTVETAFLPDRNREKELARWVYFLSTVFLMIDFQINIYWRLKEDLAKEWQALQEKEKNEEINIAFVYWDGSSHRKDLKMKKGNTISQFLVRALEVFFHVLCYHHSSFSLSTRIKALRFTGSNILLQLLKREFSETRAAVPESLMFVKEDLIIPHFYTLVFFYSAVPMKKQPFFLFCNTEL